MLAHPTDGWHAFRVVIVTGGSRGTGRAVATALTRAGYAVVVNYAHDQRGADAVVDGILRAGGTAVAIRADVADELDVARLFAESAEAFGGVDLVIHAAGPLSSQVRDEAARRFPAAGAAVVTFAGCWRPDVPVNVAALVSWLIGRRPSREALVVLPVSDVDRAKRFYCGLGWRLDVDLSTAEGFRAVQLTPRGARVSVIFGTQVTACAPGSVDGLPLPAGARCSFTDPDGNRWEGSEGEAAQSAGGVRRDRS